MERKLWQDLQWPFLMSLCFDSIQILNYVQHQKWQNKNKKAYMCYLFFCHRSYGHFQKKKEHSTFHLVVKMFLNNLQGKNNKKSLPKQTLEESCLKFASQKTYVTFILNGRKKSILLEDYIEMVEDF
ncbi:MAG: hypothetical protein J6U03_05235, partial [Muribaculaceae bacterium]|nr:hypothetical protein [Muribaculaceae bacterium]